MSLTALIPSSYKMDRVPILARPYSRRSPGGVTRLVRTTRCERFGRSAMAGASHGGDGTRSEGGKRAIVAARGELRVRNLEVESAGRSGLAEGNGARGVNIAD